MKKYILIFTIVLVAFNLQAEPPFKTHLNTGIRDDDKKCSTSGFYDANTAVTFFGDSRIDLVDSIAYGAASLDHYFATYGAWNVQNFGVSGMDSYGFKNQIQTCFTRDPSNPAKAKYPNFKIAYNVAFEMGGNDYVNTLPFFIINPALYITRIPQSRDNIASVIYTLQMREKNVLLIGNYPAVAWSVRLGSPEKYAGYGGFNPKVFQAYSSTERHRPIGEKDEKFILQVIKKIMIGSSFMPGALNVIGSIVSSLPGQEASDLNSVYQDALHSIGLDDGGKEEKDIARMAVGSYTWWKTISVKAPGTVPSVGVLLLENELRGMVNNPSAYGLKPFQYISTGEYFLYPPVKFEPWVVNPNLMTDLIHKNHLGYAIWGKLVGDKVRELGWQNEKAVDDSISSNKINYQLSKTLLALKQRYEARLAAINKELADKIASLNSERASLANSAIRNLDERVKEIERLEQEAERQRQEALAEYNRQQELARQQAEAQRIAWEAQQAENARLERERLAAEEEARRRREQEEALITVAACFFFGVCRR